MVQRRPIEVSRRSDLDIDRPFLPDHFRMDNGSPQHVASFHEVSHVLPSPRSELAIHHISARASPKRPHPPSPPLQLRIASQCCVERGEREARSDSPSPRAAEPRSWRGGWGVRSVRSGEVGRSVIAVRIYLGGTS